MTKSQILRTYKDPSIDERREFNRWANTNAVFGSIIAIALIAMAAAGSWFGDAGSANTHIIASQPEQALASALR